jgi:hypothetical protein
MKYFEKNAATFKVQKDGSVKIYDDMEVGYAKASIRKRLKERAKKRYPGQKIYFYDELGVDTAAGAGYIRKKV